MHSAADSTTPGTEPDVTSTEVQQDVNIDSTTPVISSTVEDEDDDDRPLAALGSAAPDRMRHYQSRFEEDSSDEEDGAPRTASRPAGDGVNEEKSQQANLLTEDADDDDFGSDDNGEDGYAPMDNEYAPLMEDGGMDDDEFGDFQSETLPLPNDIDALIRSQLSNMDIGHGGGGLGMWEEDTVNSESKQNTARESASAVDPDYNNQQTSSPPPTQPPNIPPLSEGMQIRR